MGRKLQTIYEYFSDYTEKKIEDVIYGLSIDEKLIIMSDLGTIYIIHHHKRIGVRKIVKSIMDL